MEMNLDLKPIHAQNKLHCYMTLSEFNGITFIDSGGFCLSLVSIQHEEHLFLKNLC